MKAEEDTRVKRGSGRRQGRHVQTNAVRALIVAAAWIIVTSLTPLAGSPASAAPTGWTAPRTVYIPETGQSIDGVFLDFWRGNNGIANYGYPITPEIEQNGHIVQYYSYARFEYWPEDPNGVIVQLGKIGEELRPKLVQRTTFPGVGTGASKSTVNQEMVDFAQAWVPLDKTAEAPNSETWRYVPETKHSVAHGFKTFWENSGEAAYLGYPLTEEYALKDTTYQIFERGQLAWQKDKDPWLVPLGEVLAKQYKISTDPIEQGDLPVYSEELFIPPAPEADASGAPPPPPGAPQSIVVSLSQQMMWAYEGETVVLSSLVSTGKPGFETPPGTFQILVKKEIEDMEGLIGGEYYNVPQVPDVMYFTDVGHAFHGTYWHNNFGTPMSHGCVNLPMDVAAWLYDWTPIGTVVLIVD